MNDQDEFKALTRGERLALAKLANSHSRERRALAARLTAAGFTIPEASDILFRSYLAGWQDGPIANGWLTGQLPSGRDWSALDGIDDDSEPLS